SFTLFPYTTLFRSALFRIAPYHETSDILEKDNRQACLIAVHYKTRRLISAVRINDAAHLNSLFLGPDLQTLVGNDPYGSPIDARVRSYDSLAIVGLVFVHRVFVADRGNQVARIVIFLTIEADQIINRARILGRLRWLFRCR